MTASTATEGASSASFTSALIAGGMPAEVAEELERRIEIVEHDEADDPSRQPWTARELVGYVLVSVAAVALGILVVAL